MKKKLAKFAVGLVCVVGIALAGGAWYLHDLEEQIEGAKTPVVDRATFTRPAQPLVVRNVSVLSDDGDRMIPGRDVVISDGLIAEIRPTAEDGSYASTFDQVDGSGLFLIPGLSDGHVHIGQRSNDLLVFLTNGVTHIREMSGQQATLDLREETRDGALGPDMFVASHKVFSDTGPERIIGELLHPRINAATPEEARALVAEIAADGYDAVKISGSADMDAFRALAKSARERNLRVVGHLQRDGGLDGLWASGQEELAHVEEIAKGLWDEYDALPEGDKPSAFAAYVDRRIDTVAARLASEDIAVTAAVWLLANVPEQKRDLAAALTEVETQYVDPAFYAGTSMHGGWAPGTNEYELPDDQKNDPAALKDELDFWREWNEACRIILNALVENDVTLMAGTDAGVPIAVPGFSMHNELQTLVAYGMTPSQALGSATATSGEWLGERRGRIAPGYKADLVLLTANPLEDIANTRKISAVIKDGSIYDRSLLDRMLEAVAAANGHGNGS